MLGNNYERLCRTPIQLRKTNLLAILFNTYLSLGTSSMGISCKRYY